MENADDMKRVETQVLREGTISENEYEILFGKTVQLPCEPRKRKNGRRKNKKQTN